MENDDLTIIETEYIKNNLSKNFCSSCDKEFITSIRDLDFINYCPLCGTKIITINRYSK